MRLVASSILFLSLAVGASTLAAQVAGPYGVLVMAHGGSDEWNESVLATVEPLRARWPVEIAFGMADAVTLQNAVAALEDAGVRRIGVVRMFISGNSWLDRTEQILGLAPGAPDQPAAHDHEPERGGHRMAFYRVPTQSTFALSVEGLMDAPESGRILADRAIALSRAPAEEDVLVLAHGPGSEEADAVWRAAIEARAAAIRDALPFRRVAVETLAEDWPQRRRLAEQNVRAFVANAAAEGTALVIPFRLSGFGPYAEVLDGLEYRADGKGLLPHGAIASWLERQAEQLLASTFLPPASDLPIGR